MITEKIKGMCHTCGEETEWTIVHRLVQYGGIRHCLKCKQCGQVVPDFLFSEYQRTGKIIIPV